MYTALQHYNLDDQISHVSMHKMPLQNNIHKDEPTEQNIIYGKTHLKVRLLKLWYLSSGGKEEGQRPLGLSIRPLDKRAKPSPAHKMSLK